MNMDHLMAKGECSLRVGWGGVGDGKEDGWKIKVE